ncbi:MAG: hypothetical protein PUF12_06555 [Thermoflexaceae bacterium]|nr:hypothetical protein [Thermoflexaceae bacterium]
MKALILALFLITASFSQDNPDSMPVVRTELHCFYENLCDTLTVQQQAQLEPAAPIGLYIYNEDAGRRELVSDTFESNWIKGNDIVSFEVYNSTESSLRGNVFLNIWPKLWENFENASDYRIGYSIDFTMENGAKKIHQNVLTPDDTLIYKDYMELYLYDDFHQQIDVWYSHVEPDAYNDETILTSIKFTAGKKYEAIDGEILLTAFFYKKDGSEFDEAGNYIGNTKVSVLVKDLNH